MASNCIGVPNIEAEKQHRLGKPAPDQGGYKCVVKTQVAMRHLPVDGGVTRHCAASAKHRAECCPNVPAMCPKLRMKQCIRPRSTVRLACLLRCMQLRGPGCALADIRL